MKDLDPGAERLAKHLQLQCKKLISRHQRSLTTKRKNQDRFEKATGLTAGKIAKAPPPHWAISPHFNPYYVRRRADGIAGGAATSIANRSFSPHPSLVVEQEKPGGGKRQISIFSVPDVAIAGMYFKKILHRNQPRLSPYSYAYRLDKKSHHAIERLARELKLRSHFYLVSFDFSKYFDTIDHDYVLGVIDNHFRLTHTERYILERFLRCKRAFSLSAYKQNKFKALHRGIPQGNSLSLFLANAACHELDLRLERQAVVFFRYADDILALTDSVHVAEAVREDIFAHCMTAGISINLEKSPGIEEFGPQPRKEITESKASLVRGRTNTVEFLGHTFHFRYVNRRRSPARHPVRRVGLRASSEARLRAKLGAVIHSHLLRYIEMGGHFSMSRLSNCGSHIQIDWDLVTCINDLRGYLYGGVPEDEIRAGISDKGHPLHKPEGRMRYYPLINDVEQLRRLDGWLLNSISTALQRRKDILRNRLGIPDYIPLTKGELKAAEWYRKAPETIKNDVRIPSILTAWKYSRRCLRAFDLRAFPERMHRGADDDPY